MKTMTWLFLLSVFPVFTFGQIPKSRVAEMSAGARSAAMLRARKLMLFRAKDQRPYFEAYVKDLYAFWDGKLVELPTLTGTIVQIPSDGKILLRLADRDETVMVDGLATHELTDGKFFGARAVENGIYSYTNVAGAKRTVRRFSLKRPLTFEQYSDLRNDGLRFPCDP